MRSCIRVFLSLSPVSYIQSPSAFLILHVGVPSSNCCPLFCAQEFFDVCSSLSGWGLTPQATPAGICLLSSCVGRRGCWSSRQCCLAVVEKEGLSLPSEPEADGSTGWNYRECRKNSLEFYPRKLAEFCRALNKYFF